MDLTRITTLEDLQKLLEVLGQYGIGEFEYESEGNRLKVAKSPSSASSGVTVLSGMPTAAPIVPALAVTSTPEAAPALPAGVKEIASPMVGTFYRSPSPEADPFVSEGDRIDDSEQTVGIIEAMKVMNEIPAGFSGVITSVLVENGESVEYGQPLFHIKAE